MNSIVIDPARCRYCNLCVEDCPREVLTATGGVPVMSVPESCIGCGHCVAVCPFAALSLNGADPDALPAPERIPQYDDVKAFLQMRRSHRNFLQKNVDRAVIDDMLDALRYVPTGNNFRRLHYTLIDDVAVLAKLRNYIHAELPKRCAGEIPPMLKSTLRGIESGGDPIFRTAPHLLVVSHHQDAPTGLVDAVIALTQFEMLAQSRKLGTLWFGRILTVMKVAMPEIREWLEIPEGYEIGYAMLFGETAAHYYRAVEATPVEVRVLKEKK